MLNAIKRVFSLFLILILFFSLFGSVFGEDLINTGRYDNTYLEMIPGETEGIFTMPTDYYSRFYDETTGTQFTKASEGETTTLSNVRESLSIIENSGMLINSQSFEFETVDGDKYKYSPVKIGDNEDIVFNVEKVNSWYIPNENLGTYNENIPISADEQSLSWNIYKATTGFFVSNAEASEFDTTKHYVPPISPEIKISDGEDEWTNTGEFADMENNDEKTETVAGIDKIVVDSPGRDFDVDYKYNEENGEWEYSSGIAWWWTSVSEMPDSATETNKAIATNLDNADREEGLKVFEELGEKDLEAMYYHLNSDEEGQSVVKKSFENGEEELIVTKGTQELLGGVASIDEKTGEVSISGDNEKVLVSTDKSLILTNSQAARVLDEFEKNDIVKVEPKSRASNLEDENLVQETNSQQSAAELKAEEKTSLTKQLETCAKTQKNCPNGYSYDPKSESRLSQIVEYKDKSGIVIGTYLVPVKLDGSALPDYDPKVLEAKIKTYSNILLNKPSFEIDDKLPEEDKLVFNALKGKDISDQIGNLPTESLLIFGNIENLPQSSIESIATKLIENNLIFDDLSTIYKGVTNKVLADAMMGQALKYTQDALNVGIMETDYSKIEALCKGDSEKCGQSLFDVALAESTKTQPLTSEQETAKQLAQDLAFSLINDGTVKWTVGDISNFGYQSGEALADAENYREALTKIQKTDCDGFFGSMWCSVSDGQNTKENYLNGLKTSIDKIKSDFVVMPSDGIVIGSESKTLGYFGKDVEGVTFDCNSVTVKTCIDNNKVNIENYCTKNKIKGDCNEFFTSELEKLAVIKDGTGLQSEGKALDKDGYNDALYNNFLGTLDAESCKGLVDCQEKADAAVEAACPDGAFMDPTCIKAIAGQKAIEQYEQHTYSVGMVSLMGALTQSDPKALDAAKTLFGAEADYSGLGKLGQEIPAGICEAKIEGYLDKTIESAGTATKYGCLDNPDFEENDPSNPCLNVIVDLRAKRTEVTPDNFTAVSFSYYIHAPEDEAIKFVVAMSYVANGKKEKELLLNVTNVDENGVGADFHNFDIELTNKDATDFRIAIAAFYSDDSVYENVGATIILATPGAYYSEEGNTQGNEEEQSSNPSQDLSPQEMLDLANI